MSGNAANPKKRCIDCNRVMKQQFIGLKHCKCGTSWSKSDGYFKRTSDMVFALERKVTKKGKNSVRTKQVPVIRFKEGAEASKDAGANNGTICPGCKGNMRTANGCKPSALISDSGNRYARVKVGGVGDFYEDSNADAPCTDCGAKHGHFHHRGCDCERCPICDGQLLLCGCVPFPILRTINSTKKPIKSQNLHSYLITPKALCQHPLKGTRSKPTNARMRSYAVIECLYIAKHS